MTLPSYLSYVSTAGEILTGEILKDYGKIRINVIPQSGTGHRPLKSKKAALQRPLDTENG
jgi:hypothetical protein